MEISFDASLLFGYGCHEVLSFSVPGHSLHSDPRFFSALRPSNPILIFLSLPRRLFSLALGNRVLRCIPSSGSRFSPLRILAVKVLSQLFKLFLFRVLPSSFYLLEPPETLLFPRAIDVQHVCWLSKLHGLFALKTSPGTSRTCYMARPPLFSEANRESPRFLEIFAKE